MKRSPDVELFLKLLEGGPIGPSASCLETGAVVDRLLSRAQTNLPYDLVRNGVTEVVDHRAEPMHGTRRIVGYEDIVYQDPAIVLVYTPATQTETASLYGREAFAVDQLHLYRSEQTSFF